MLDEGAGTRDALALADAVDFLGASLGTSSSFDASTISLRSLVSTFDQALPLFADVALRPTFPQTEMDRLRTERETTLLQLRDNPGQLASASFARLLFGSEHRYGTSLMGTEATNKALTVADLRDVLPGALSARQRPSDRGRRHDAIVRCCRSSRARSARGRMRRRVDPAATLAAANKPASRHVYLVNKPGAAQSQIRIGTVGVARSTPDYFTLDVLNTILGGLVLLSAEPEPPGGARLFLRRRARASPCA